MFGFDLVTNLSEFKLRAEKEIEKLTTMNVQKINIVAKGIKILDENKEE